MPTSHAASFRVLRKGTSTDACPRDMHHHENGPRIDMNAGLHQQPIRSVDLQIEQLVTPKHPMIATRRGVHALMYFVVAMLLTHLVAVDVDQALFNLALAMHIVIAIAIIDLNPTVAKKMNVQNGLAATTEIWARPTDHLLRRGTRGIIHHMIDLLHHHEDVEILESHCHRYRVDRAIMYPPSEVDWGEAEVVVTGTAREIVHPL